MGTVCGLTSRAPLPFKTSYCSRRVVTPPIPDATTTPRRSLSISGEPASFQASRDAIKPNCSERSRRLISTRSICSLGSTATRAAKVTGIVCAHSSVRVRTPLVPVKMPAQVVATSPPKGVVAPSPVTTTRRRVIV